MSNRSTKIIAIISISLFLMSIVAFVVAFVVVNNQKEAYLQNERARAERTAFAMRNTNLIAALEETQNERAILSAQIIEEGDVVDLLTVIEALGKEQGVALTTKSLTVEAIDNTFETLVIQLEVDGSYEAIIHLLTILEHLPYHSSVSSVQLDRQGGEVTAWKGVFQLRVSKFKKNET